MFINYGDKLDGVNILGIAVSGGSDSMALLKYTADNAAKLGVDVVAVNVEHGIRGKSSLSDSAFVKDYCAAEKIPVISYSVNAIKYAETHKLSIEEAARILRYDCFYRAIREGKCDKIATAHHLSDNLESVLINLFRGTGIKGLSGIKDSEDGLIIRPMTGVKKTDITAYLKERDIPFVDDESNFCDDYTRNFLRRNVIPKIKEVFPEAESTVYRLSRTAGAESDYLDEEAASRVQTENDGTVVISLPLSKVILSRAAIIALKKVGIRKDYAKTHVDAIVKLAESENGKRADLLNGVTAHKEYDRIVLTARVAAESDSLPFFTGEKKFGRFYLSICETARVSDLKSGLYADMKKISETAVVRTRKEGDRFVKFGGGEKSLGDYFTDRKIPLRTRSAIPLLADGNRILVIFGVAVSDLIKVDETTEKIIKFTCEETK